MPKITFIDPAGKRTDVDAREGESVMLAALVGMVAGIEAECGGACSCGTCLVQVEPGWREAVGGPNELEAGMLEVIDNVTEGCRLSCQIPVTGRIDGLIVKVAG